MQQPSRTVIFGEAPEESDSEEIELNNETRNSTEGRQYGSARAGNNNNDQLHQQTGSKGFSMTSVFNADQNCLDKQTLQQLPLLHRTLYSKNYQFRASINHLHKHPLQVATKGVHSMSQGLVNDQKILQEVNNEMVKIQREQRNLDIGISLIIFPD